MRYILKTRLLKGVVTRNIGLGLPPEVESAGGELRSLIQERFGRSLHIREVDTGSCGACESEIISANNPIYDIQRFGVNFVASPRHADALLVTGPVSKNMALALRRTYEAMPDPKFVISLGDCTRERCAFRDSYYVAGPVHTILPVALHIPGCPPSPAAIITSLLGFFKE